MTDQVPVRLDKWLWAARFFKTRSLARAAIEGGKIRYNDQRTKPGKVVTPGSKIIIPQGWDEKTVIVLAVSNRRGNATTASELYEETPESRQQREARADARKASSSSSPPTGKPDKKQRRLLRNLRENR